MKILLLGSKGQLGRCLSEHLIHTDFDVTFTSRNQIDIVDVEATRNKIIDISPDVVINTSAYTAVEAAEENEAVPVLNADDFLALVKSF